MFGKHCGRIQNINNFEIILSSCNKKLFHSVCLHHYFNKDICLFILPQTNKNVTNTQCWDWWFCLQLVDARARTCSLCVLYTIENCTLYFKKVCAMAGLEPAITGMGEFYVRRLDHSAKLLCYSETSTFAYIKCCIHFTEVCSFLTVKRERKIVLIFNK